MSHGCRNLESLPHPNYGLAELAPGEIRLAVRRRLSAAADRRGWALAFLRTESEQLAFRVREVFGA